MADTDTEEQGLPITDAGRAALGADDLKNPGASLMRHINRNAELARQSSAKTKEAQAPVQQERAGLVKKEGEMLDAGPRQVPMPKPPQQKQQELSGLFSALLALAAFSGKASRQPLTAALNAMTGMAQGWASGNKEMADQSYKVWDAETKKAIAQNKTMLDSYNRVLKRMDLSITEKDQMIRLIATEHQDQLALEALDKQGLEYLAKLADAQQKAKAAAEKKADAWRMAYFKEGKIDARHGDHERHADARQAASLDARDESAALARASKADPKIKSILDREKSEIAAAKAAGMKPEQILAIKTKYDRELGGQAGASAKNTVPGHPELELDE